MSKPLFTDQELKKIEEAVAAAEKKTSGEIVPYFVESSDGYPDAFWKFCGILMVVSNLITALIMEYSGWFFPFGIFETLMAVSGTVLILSLIAIRIPAVLRFAAGKATMNDRVTARAAEAFVSEEVFATRSRTGILIFISNLEHRVLVIGDAGINRKVKPETWNEVAALVVSGIRTGKAADGIISAIAKCGDILESAGVAIQNDDTNEIGNELRIGN